MSVRRNTTNRLTLFRTCYVCGQTMITTADSPFMRVLANVDGKKQKICYFCSESCKQSTYIHNFDGLEWQRRKEREKARDITAKNRRFYEAHAEAMRERSRAYRAAMSDEEREAEKAFRRAKYALTMTREKKDERNALLRQRRAERKSECISIPT